MANPKTADPYASLPEAADPYASLPESSASTEAPKSFYQRLGPVGRAASSFLSGFGYPESAQEHPSDVPQGLKAAVTHPGLELESLKQMYNSMTKAQQDLIDEAFFKQHMPGIKNKAEGFALGVYSAIPLFGPAIVNAIRQFQSGDIAGGAGSAAAIIAQVYKPGEGRIATEPVRGEPGAVGRIKPPISETARRTLQGLTGAGPEKTTEPLIEKFKQQAQNVAEKNRATTEKAFRTAGERKATYEQEVREQQEKYRADTQAVQDFNQAQEDVAGRKQALAELNESESADLGVDLATLESNVYKEANRKFNDVRNEVKGQERAPGKLISNVKDTEKNVLQGIPENVKEFRRILGLEGEEADPPLSIGQDMEIFPGEEGYEAVKEAYKEKGIFPEGGGLRETEPLTWDLLQSLKSRIDRRLRSGRGMNGDLKRALFGVRDGIVDEMGSMVGDRIAAGGPPTLLDDWLGARSFYRQWREDFHTPAGPSGSGSPVAQALDAVDPARIRKPFLGDAQQRGLVTLRKYGQFGGNQVADRTARVIARQNEHDSISPQKPKAAPPRPKEVPQPKTVEVQYKGVKTPMREDIVRAKERALRETAISWGKLHTYDLGIIAGSVLGAVLGHWQALFADPAFVAIRKSFGVALSRPDVRVWLSQPLPEEMRALEGLPEALKEDARDSVQEFIRKERSAGRPIKLAPPVQAFLGITRKPKKPGEQIEDLGQISGSNPFQPRAEQ